MEEASKRVVLDGSMFKSVSPPTPSNTLRICAEKSVVPPRDVPLNLNLPLDRKRMTY